MAHLIIIGAGGFGPEVLSVAQAMLVEQKLTFKGFLDDNKTVLKQRGGTYPVLGRCEAYMPEEGDRFICAIADPKTKLRICNRLVEKGAIFVNLIHSSAFVSEEAELGMGLIAFPHTFISTQTTIGDFVTLNASSVVGHHAQLDSGCTLSPHATVSGFAHLKQGAFMGSSSTVMLERTVGEFARIGAGSVAVRHVKPGHTVFGLPAKTIFEDA
ncbi:MAG: acetyltransferase [Gammaproteobacteria bacterium]|nr:acetyltransferase [Gammaproteobacteria bacterium]